MKAIYAIFSLLICIETSYGQNPEGTWKGHCIWEDQTSLLEICFIHRGGNTYDGYGLEKMQDGGQVSFTITIHQNEFDGTGLTPKLKIRDIVVVRNGTTTKFKNYLEVEKLGSAKAVYAVSTCLCDDNKRVTFAYDNDYNYFESECYDQLVYWSLAQKRKKVVAQQLSKS